MLNLLFYKRGIRDARSHWLYISTSKRTEGGYQVYATGDKNLPSWAPTPTVFWAAADRYERSTIRYRELVALLPRQLAHDNCISLVRLCSQLFFGNRYVYSWAIQESHSRKCPWAMNPRVHIMFCDRLISDPVSDPPKSCFFTAFSKDPSRPAGYPKSLAFRGQSLKTWLDTAADIWKQKCGDALYEAGYINNPLVVETLKGGCPNCPH